MNRLLIIIIGIIALTLMVIFIELRYFAFMLGIGIVLVLIGIHDYFQKTHTILRNFPVLGHFRYLLEFIRPEIQQYFISSNKNERPFNRETRSLIYQRAKNMRDTIPFGTQSDVDVPGYETIRHSLKPTVVDPSETRLMIGGKDCKHLYCASRLNISAMSFGALSRNAVLALNEGAKLGHFYHNTGEGGLTPYHLQGGDVVWQLGTAYFGCRDKNGNFDAAQFKDKAQHDHVKMIEIKLSQGAKPSHGGILPAAKITKEIAEIRGVDIGKDCLSPPAHTAFDSPTSLLEYVAHLRELTGGKPIGFKLCIGVRSQFLGICKAMLATQIYPDFITVDGAAGGTGAAPVEFTNYLGEFLNDALVFVNSALVGIDVRDQIRIIGSGKVTNGFDILSKIALGADVCNSARGMMFALGCIQSLQCNANTCPTGVTTQNPLLMRGLVVPTKAQRVANFHRNTMHSFLELVGATGVNHIADLNPAYIFHRINYAETRSYAELYPKMHPGELLSKDIPTNFERDWKLASADKF